MGKVTSKPKKPASKPTAKKPASKPVSRKPASKPAARPKTAKPASGRKSDSVKLSSESKKPEAGSDKAKQFENANSEPKEPKSNLWDTSLVGYGGWDGDKNGYLTNQEIEKALKNKNLSPEKKAALETLRGRQSQLEEMHNDEHFDENNGISRSDLRAMRDARSQDTRIMEEQFGLEHGLATESSSVKRAAASRPNQPADLRDKIGTRDYYLERYKDFRRRNPNEKAPDYYMNYGLKYFDRFSSKKPEVSAPTKRWIDNTAVKLQEKMEAPNTASGLKFANMERNPEKFKEFAYGTHPSAYLEGGLANVPAGDLAKIPFVPDLKDLATVDGVSQGIETGWGYGKIQGRRAYRSGMQAAEAGTRKAQQIGRSGLRSLNSGLNSLSRWASGFF